VLARKLGIVAVAVGLANTNAYQLAMMLLVLFAAFVVQVRWAMGGEGEKGGRAWGVVWGDASVSSCCRGPPTLSCCR
jgi:hypothetical protein